MSSDNASRSSTRSEPATPASGVWQNRPWSTASATPRFREDVDSGVICRWRYGDGGDLIPTMGPRLVGTRRESTTAVVARDVITTK